MSKEVLNKEQTIALFNEMLQEKVAPILEEREFARIFIKSIKKIIDSDDSEVQKTGMNKLEYIDFLISEFINIDGKK